MVVIVIVRNRWCDTDGTALSPRQQTGGPGYDTPCSSSQYSGSHCYCAKPFVRRYRSGDDTALSPQQQRTSSYSGHSGGPGYDIQCSPPQYSGSHCYRAKPFVRRYSGGDGTAPSPQQQTTSSYSGRSGGPGYDIPCSLPQYSGSHCYRAKPFVRRYSGGDSTSLSPQQQPGPHPFSSFGWEQRYACYNRPPVNAGLANNIAQG